MTIKYYQKRVYGNVKQYIVDEATAQAWTTLTGDRTVEPNKAKALADLLGGSVEWQQVPDPSIKPL
jgi:hypothetical protein